MNFSIKTLFTLVVGGALLSSVGSIYANTSVTLSGSSGDRNVKLNWTDPGSGSIFQIYQDTDSNPSGRVRIAALSSNTHTYTATGLENGKTYYFWVKYTNSDGTVANSAYYSATPGTKTSSSQSVTGTAASGDGEVKLSWTASGNGSNYQILQDTDSNPSGRARIAILPSSTLSYTATGLTNGKTYYFWVKYTNSDGSSSNSPVFSATPKAASSSSTETVTGSAASGDSEVKLSWTDPGNGSYYQILQDTDSNPGGRTRIAILPSTTLSYTATGLTNGKTYYFWVKYIKSDGTSGNSPVFSATPKASASSLSAPIGFAGQPGDDGLSTTTGGGNAKPVVVTSCSALSTALSASGPSVIQIPDDTTLDCRTAPRAQAACQMTCASNWGEPNKLYYWVGAACTGDGEKLVNLTRDETTMSVSSNKTLEGLGANSKLVGVSLNLNNVQNIIIRNLAIENVNPGMVEANDGISMKNTSHIWLDHLRLGLISDGYIDMYNSKNVTLSWNQFDGENPAVCGQKHFYTQIIDNSEVTLHHNNWFNVAGRNPKITGEGTRAHLFNNYWKNVSYFSIRVLNYAQARIQDNYFEDASIPHQDRGNGLIDADISSNRYIGKSATDKAKDTGATVFGDLNLYSFTAESADNVPTSVGKGAGPQ